MSAKGTRRCFAGIGPATRISRIRTRKALGRMDAETGEAECATTQTVHWDSSAELECWWVTKLYADKSVSNRHDQAICFKSDRMKTPPQQ